MLLYIHVPFCRQKCRYCGFESAPPGPGQEELFVRGVCHEARVRANGLDSLEVRTLYVGGGTPSLLTPTSLARILETVRSSFDLAPSAEITVEANPESAENKEFHSTLVRLGVNRLSLGVQALDDEMLRLLGRTHTRAQALRSIDLARRAGLDNIGLDLIWGLPGQSLRQWLGQLKEAVRLRPRHLSCYGLSLEPGTPMARDVESGLLALPEEREQSQMYVLGAEYLESVGLIQYEVSNFSVMDYTGSHNLGYWAGEDYIGLGPGAVSTIGSRRWKNPFPLDDYLRAMSLGLWDENREDLLPIDRTNEFIMLSLRTTKGLDIREYTGRTGHDIRTRHRQTIRALRSAGLARLTASHLRLTKTGMVVGNQIITRFMLDREN
ncbi:MAG: radical SAM family heme chaperone HemW [Deltaproteobacteria bacterium]|nr:radical SAM family heme chaperone HemW [Deltaproteobacteria bacterium]